MDNTTQVPLPELTGEYVARLSVTRFVLPYAAALALLAPVSLVVLFVLGRAFPSTLGLRWTPSLTLLLLVCAPASAVFGLVYGLGLRWLYSARVNTEGVRGFSVWSVPLCIRWEDVVRVEARRYLGIPNLVIHSQSKKALWFILLVDDLPAVRNYIVRHAGPDNPMAYWLTTNVRG